MSIESKIKNCILAATFAGIDYSNIIPSHSGRYTQLADGYAHDILLPAALYFFYGIADLGTKLGRAAFVFLGCSTFELAQAVKLYPGTFDTKDFIAYAAGTGLALGIDAIMSRTNQKNC